jgi:hypothetical protein
MREVDLAQNVTALQELQKGSRQLNRPARRARRIVPAARSISARVCSRREVRIKQAGR